MAVTVCKTAELIGSDIISIGRGGRPVHTVMVAVLGSLEEVDGSDLSLAWNLELEIGSGASAKNVTINLPAFLTRGDYELSRKEPYFIGESSYGALALFRDKFFAVEPSVKHQTMREEAILRIKRDVCAAEAEITTLKSYVANMEAVIAFERSGPKRERSRPNAWCSFMLTRLISALRRIDHAPGTAESMMIGLSLKGAMVSSVMYRAR